MDKNNCLNIAFIAKKLESGGTEVSLINLLKRLSLNKEYKITLFVLEKKGIYVNDIPKNIEIFEIFDKKSNSYMNRLDMQNKKLIDKVKIIYMKILRRINAKIFRKIMLKKTKKVESIYDIAIDFHGYGYMGTNYIIDIINAKKKVTFIHDENIDWIYKIKDVFPKFDYYMCVSNSCKKILEEKYSYTKGKTVICRNIVDKEKVVKLSEVKCKEIFNPNIINFLTIGRLEYQKGYDLLLDVAEKLKQKNINFKWYIIGGGSLKSELELDIERRNLNDKVILCGIQKNPYNYLKECDYYVQTSRHEGYGIAIAEARILKKIVISTDIECVREQINNGENGILCKFEADDFLEKIIHLIKDKEYRLELQKKINNQEFNDNNDMDAFLRNVCKRKEG